MNTLTDANMEFHGPMDPKVTNHTAFLIRMDIIKRAEDAAECIRLSRILGWEEPMLVRHAVRDIVRDFRVAEAMGDEQDLRESKLYLANLEKVRTALRA